MSQLSSTLKRYVDSSRYAEATYGRVPGGYSSYTSYGSTLTTAYADSDKIGFKASYLPSPRYHHSGLSPTSAYDSGRLPLYPDSGIRLSPAYLRTQHRPPGGGLSGGSCYTFTGTPSSPSGYLPSSAPLSRRKSISHSDLVQEFSGLRTSESAYASSPGARGRQELGALQGLYQAAAHSDYVRDYLESCERKSSHCSFPCSPPGPSQAALSSAGTRGASQPCERSDGYGGTSAPDPLVGGAPWRGGDGTGLVGSRVLCGFILSLGGWRKWCAPFWGLRRWGRWGLRAAATCTRRAGAVSPSSWRCPALPAPRPQQLRGPPLAAVAAPSHVLVALGAPAPNQRCAIPGASSQAGSGHHARSPAQERTAAAW